MSEHNQQFAHNRKFHGDWLPFLRIQFRVAKQCRNRRPENPLLRETRRLAGKAGSWLWPRPWPNALGLILCHDYRIMTL